MSKQRARFAASIAASILLCASASCGLIAGVPSIADGGAGGTAPACTEDADCNDGNPCTTDACGEDKLCVRDPFGDGSSPTGGQKAGDCKKVVCQDGKPEANDDLTDTPDDGEDCTIDACTSSGPSYEPKPVGTTCEDSTGRAGSCDALGKCHVACVAVMDCASSNPCIVPSCDTTKGVCVDTPVPDGTPTPGFAQVAGDCLAYVCVGGVDTKVTDDNDLPVTQTDCDDEVCTGGAPSNPPKQPHTPCSTYMSKEAGFCDGKGACSQCSVDVDCPGVTDDCKHPACDPAGACTVVFTPPMTATVNDPAQVAGDCATRVCDGMGGTMKVLLPSDASDDGNGCTQDACAAVDVSTHMTLPNGTKCGVGGTLACVNGACTGCTVNAQCPQPACMGTLLIKGQTCNGLGQCAAPAPPAQDCAPYVCSMNACATSCTNDAGCSQAGNGNYCNAGTCLPKAPNGAACTANNRCQSNHCAPSNGVCCSAACVDQGAASCGTRGACAPGTGACLLYDNTTACSATSCTGSTIITYTSCNGTGVCNGGAMTAACPGNYVCANATTCFTACGASDPVGDAKCASTHYCNGFGAGTCNVKKIAGGSCNRNGQCQSGTCNLGVGACL